MPDPTLKSSNTPNEAGSLRTGIENLSITCRIETPPCFAKSASTAHNFACIKLIHTKYVEESYSKSCKIKKNCFFKHKFYTSCCKNNATQPSKDQVPKKRFLKPNLNLPNFNMCNMPPLSLNLDLDKIDGI